MTLPGLVPACITPLSGEPVAAVQVTQTGKGITSWAYKCMEFAEGIQKEFVDALEEHDAAITRADLPGLHGACLSALRKGMHHLGAGQPSDTLPQVVSIKRMEERVQQMKKQLSNKQEVEQTLRTTVHGLQKENIALQQVLRFCYPLAAVQSSVIMLRFKAKPLMSR